jgi:hypothetical protein
MQSFLWFCPYCSLVLLSREAWAEMKNGKEVTERWLAQQLRPYGIKPRTIWIDGTEAKGYVKEELMEIFRRYISKSDLTRSRVSRNRRQSPKTVRTP